MTDTPDAPMYGQATTSIEAWVAAGRPGPVGAETRWSALHKEQWQRDLNGGLDISQVPATSTVVAFYWKCQRGHLWREAPSGRSKKVKWYEYAEDSRCRACALEDHAARYACGHTDDRFTVLGNRYDVPCGDCRGSYTCGYPVPMHAAGEADTSGPCPYCAPVAERLKADPELVDALERQCQEPFRVAHEPLSWWCGVEGHAPFSNTVRSMVQGFGCKACFKLRTTQGHATPVGTAFRSSYSPGGSKMETSFRESLKELLPALVADPEEVNAVSIDGEFFGRGEVYPDVLLPTRRIAVEIDHSGRDGQNHTGHLRERDRLKDTKLTQAGWAVIRLRLRELDPLDTATCVMARSASKAAAAKIAEVIERMGDAGSPGRDAPYATHVIEGPAPSATPRRSPAVSRIAEDERVQDGYYFAWNPTGVKGGNITMRLSLGGRYLYTHYPDRHFVAEVNLHEQPVDAWRDLLTAALHDAHPDTAGITKWPWGETLFVTTDESDVNRAVLEACERRVRLDDAEASFTISGAPLASFDERDLRDANGHSLVTLHPDAISLGYRVVDAYNANGPYGLYQVVTVTRRVGLGACQTL